LAQRKQLKSRVLRSGTPREEWPDMVAKVQTGSLSGTDAIGVVVEISQTRGLPGFDIVGLAEAALRESRVRVTTAISNSGYPLPDRKYVVNLAPADVRKSGASFDLAIAMALLAAAGLCPLEGYEETLFLGELSLDGQLRASRGMLAQLRGARRRGLRRAIVPYEDAAWAELVPDMSVYVARELKQVVDAIQGKDQLTLASSAAMRDEPEDMPVNGYGDLCDVYGQETAKRALEIAAAGEHNLLMVGPPGAGKTMLASRLPRLLPDPTPEEALEIATIASVSGIARGARSSWQRPFRSPHHGCSEQALIGGGAPIRPGEVTLAHRGVLFLDELPEFRRNAIEALRPTMESGRAVVVRAREHVVMPAKPLLVAAMNPCPCGFWGDAKRLCRCTYDQIVRYRARLSGPVIDRFDLHVRLAAVPVHALTENQIGEASSVVRARVVQARERARERARDASAQPTERTLDESARALLIRCIDSLNLSLRAYAKILSVARTLADIEGEDAVHRRYIAEAVQYRVLDRDPRHQNDPSFHAADGGVI
jgi:magnesium chelatase family protein